MDAGYKLNKPSPKKTANVCSKLFYVWLVSLFRKGIKGKISLSDLYTAMDSDKSEVISNKLEYYWFLELEKSKKSNRKPSLLRSMCNAFSAHFMLYGLYYFIQFALLRSFQPVLISLFVQMFTTENLDNPHKESYMYIYGFGLIFVTLLVAFFQHHVYLELSRAGMRWRVACSSLIYRKTLKLSKKSLSATAGGQIVNLISNDLTRFDFVAPMLHTAWVIPIQVAIITYFIYEEVQESAFAGVGAMILLTLPVQGIIAKLSTYLRTKTAKRTDYRVKLMGELIGGIQVVKMYVWEKPFEKIVEIARKKEIDLLTYTSYIRGCYASFAVFTERTTLYFSVICYYILGNKITAHTVFSMAQFYNILQMSMAIFFPLAVTLGAEALVSIQRLEEILMMEERHNDIELSENPGIIIEDLTASWVLGQPNLINLNLRVPEGMLCAIVGPVGSGKSTILQLLLGELRQDHGSVKIGGNISYASQEPWLFVSTVRKNIVFIQNYNKFRYNKIVKVCALERDFELFPNGDKTMVGERGVSLSGGQRARINLARAIYKDADIYLLDDPLSAVDTHVANHLFDECINGYLKGKTRILVTHQLQFLKKVDHIIVLNNGKVEAQGTFNQLLSSNSNFMRYLQKQEESQENELQNEMNDIVLQHRRTESLASTKSAVSEFDAEINYEDNEESSSIEGTNPFSKYIQAGSNLCSFICLTTLLIIGQIATSLCDYFLTFWTKSDEATPRGSYTYVYIYTGVVVACIFFVTLRSIMFFKFSMNASKNLHNKMFHSLLKAPMRFFDTNPSGRILNRFSRDMGAMDEVLPRVGIDAIQIFLVMCGIIVMIGIANPYMVIAAVILGIFFLQIRRWYALTAKDIKHLEGTTKSPVLSHLSATINGIETVRANSCEIILKSEFDEHQNIHTSAWYLTITCMAAVGLWLDFLCVIFLMCIVLGFIIMDYFNPVESSNVGLAISQAMILTGMLQFGVRQSTEVVNQMTSVERILEYTNIESEENLDQKTIRTQVTKSWPQHGKVEFKHLYLRYSPGESPVLKNLSFTIQPGEKVGIVGRTGAGKSSIISALFRLTNLEGSIYIDNVDTSSLSIYELREKISIIPQEPVLFSSTVRYNLDPFNNYKDSEIYNVLDQVELKRFIPSLDFEIDEGGANFSVGQRQLLCLARAILRNNKILVLDEATANVDHTTDSLIQTTIRKRFQSFTVLTIAHRLNTIMDSDKILVMDAGKLVEFDHPHILLQNRDGFLYKMVEETGSAMMSQLMEIAEATYVRDTRL
ncbi:ATP-binding cassette sub-family C member 4-like [Onthophagus taurus]|uniref:ATP-binding cassette sub-family C member 4-like n=1 Tax=Onthophagus taurus TaxID=166361 RepID=UPI0039BDBFD6